MPPAFGCLDSCSAAAVLEGRKEGRRVERQTRWGVGALVYMNRSRAINDQIGSRPPDRPDGDCSWILSLGGNIAPGWANLASTLAGGKLDQKGNYEYCLT